MSKRHAAEALEEVMGVDSPASKRSRRDGTDSLASSSSLGLNGTGGANGSALPLRQDAPNGMEIEQQDEAQEEMDEMHDDLDDEPQEKAPIRQAAPTAGYDDLYLDTIDRSALDFDFEKLCSVSLSNINVYACLVCGKYFQGRGPKSHAYFHALDEDHHVYINMETQRVYVLPEGYEVHSKSLDDIKYVSDPRYTKAEVAALDKPPANAEQAFWTLAGKKYTPGFVGMNNIKENDYLNVIVQALSHVPPLRNYLLLLNASSTPPPSELAKRAATLFRKIWNPRAFKSHVSPHELLQEVALRSAKTFTLTTQSDPVDFLSWFLQNLHTGLGGTRKPNSSIIHATFQGRLRVESQAITPKADAGDRLRFEEAAEVKAVVTPFTVLPLDLPPAPLFQDDLGEEGRSIIPQVPLTSLMAKYDGLSAQEHLSHRRRYRLLHPLPPYLILHVKRFSTNKFVSERNPTIVTFDARGGLDVAPYVEPAAGQGSEPILYDLVANVVHEAVRRRDDVADTGEERKTWKVQLRDKGREEWVVAQDLWVEGVQSELLYLGETYVQIWERRRGKGKGRV